LYYLEFEFPCPNNCSSHGICHYGQCICNIGFTDLDCNTPLYCSVNCGSNGVCINGRCICLPSYSGIDCNIYIPIILPMLPSNSNVTHSFRSDRIHLNEHLQIYYIPISPILLAILCFIIGCICTFMITYFIEYISLKKKSLKSVNTQQQHYSYSYTQNLNYEQ
jgi:hypothetical protein